jgi:GTP pyrophosphokinase
VLELQLDAKTPDEFLEFLKLDLYQDEIFVFTPTGDVIQLPKGATPIDFAFAVHTEDGLHACGARINGRQATLARELPQLRHSRSCDIAFRETQSRLAFPRAHGRARHKIVNGCASRADYFGKLGREILNREVSVAAFRSR